MRKLSTRPPRFVALDNRAVDDLRLSVLDVGLLALALRCPDGAEFTVASTARKRKPGREALTGAMRNLVKCGYVVKLKIQDARCGTWRTEFSVADLPFNHDDVADMLAHVNDARAIRVEPEWLDPRRGISGPEVAPGSTPRSEDAQRTARVTGSRNSAATRPNRPEPQVAPTDGFPTVGEPIVGDPSAKRERLQVQDSSLSSVRGGGGVNRSALAWAERETSLPDSTPAMGAAVAPSVARVSVAAAGGGSARAAQPAVGVRAVGDQVAGVWAMAREQRGFAVPVLGVKRVARAAAALASSGTPETLLLQAAADMARNPAWLNLERHLEYWTPPSATPRTEGPPKAYCDECDYGWVTGEDGRARKCPCRQRGAVE